MCVSVFVTLCSCRSADICMCVYIMYTYMHVYLFASMFSIGWSGVINC